MSAMKTRQKTRKMLLWASFLMFPATFYCLSPHLLEVNQMVQKENMENPECILCGTCADCCPNGTIRYRLG